MKKIMAWWNLHFAAKHCRGISETIAAIDLLKICHSKLRGICNFSPAWIDLIAAANLCLRLPSYAYKDNNNQNRCP